MIIDELKSKFDKYVKKPEMLEKMIQNRLKEIIEEERKKVIKNEIRD